MAAIGEPQFLHLTPLPMSTTFCMAPDPFRVEFNPQQDITAYELAILLPFFVGGIGITEAVWDSLGAAQRHLKRAE